MQNTNRSASRKFGVDEKRVREWRKQKEDLKGLPPKKKRMTGGGHRAALPEMEENLAAWIENMRAQNARVTRSSVQMKALELAHQDCRHFNFFFLCFSLFTLLLGDVDFRASDGWLQKFLQRQHFSLRRKTTVSQRLPQDLVPKVTGFIMYTRKLRHHKGYPLSHIVNMDETPLWFDMPGETTITRTGERSVPI